MVVGDVGQVVVGKQTGMVGGINETVGGAQYVVARVNVGCVVVVVVYVGVGQLVVSGG